MQGILIGSMALAYQLDKLKIKHDIKPNDVDIIVKDEDTLLAIFNKFKAADQFEYLLLSGHKKFSTKMRAFKADGVIYEVAYPENKECTTYDIVAAADSWDDVIEIGGITLKVAPLNLLYSLKFSHRFLKNSPHFLKTMRTIQVLRRLPFIDVWDADWMERRIKETYDYKHPNLKVSKDSFFNSNFDYVYDHDSIHEAVKVLDKPAYTFYMDGDAEVNCSREKFFAQDMTIRLLGVLEEAYVLAIERSQVPNNFNIDPRRSFNIALEKVCTSITSGWFREFAWEHYAIVQQMYDSIYVDKFKLALQKGQIKPYQGES